MGDDQSLPRPVQVCTPTAPVRGQVGQGLARGAEVTDMGVSSVLSWGAQAAPSAWPCWVPLGQNEGRGLLGGLHLYVRSGSLVLWRMFDLVPHPAVSW